MATYDENVLHDFAEKLYRQAATLIFISAVKYGFVAMVGAFVGFRFMPPTIDSDTRMILFWGTVFIAVLIGIKAGQDRAFAIRLEAQRVLVLAEIERNTRQPTAIIDEKNSHSSLSAR